MAVSVTIWFWGKLALHVAPQLMPSGLLMTTPAPATVTESIGLEIGLNVALTFFAASIVAVQVPVPTNKLDIKSQAHNLEGGISHPLINTLRQRLTLGVMLAVRENETSLLGKPYSFVIGEPTGHNQATVVRVFQDYTTPNVGMTMHWLSGPPSAWGFTP